jgi:hypothetical protein
MTEYSYVDSYTDSYLCNLFIYFYMAKIINSKSTSYFFIFLFKKIFGVNFCTTKLEKKETLVARTNFCTQL